MPKTTLNHNTCDLTAIIYTCILTQISKYVSILSNAWCFFPRHHAVDIILPKSHKTSDTQICYLSFQIMISLQKAGKKVSDIAILYALLSTSLTGMLNPLLYGLFDSSYRNGYKYIMTKIKHTCSCCRREFKQLPSKCVSVNTCRVESLWNSPAASWSAYLGRVWYLILFRCLTFWSRFLMSYAHSDYSVSNSNYDIADVVSCLTTESMGVRTYIGTN